MVMWDTSETRDGGGGEETIRLNRKRGRDAHNKTTVFAKLFLTTLHNIIEQLIKCSPSLLYKTLYNI